MIATCSSFAAETLQQPQLVKCSLLDSEVPPSPIKLVEPMPLQQNIAGNAKVVYGTYKGLDYMMVWIGHYRIDLDSCNLQAHAISMEINRFSSNFSHSASHHRQSEGISIFYSWSSLGRAWASPTLAGLHCKTRVYVCLRPYTVNFKCA